ncbi:RT0821/Lpp0805 family surface protein [Labrenzia sp. VG12]|uniref:RT0821/Lpp0805 family surface protein n=1 Tax=Labrenzia sp. VG12 TaxID=2021862 RepID=UPI0012FD887D
MIAVCAGTVSACTASSSLSPDPDAVAVAVDTALVNSDQSLAARNLQKALETSLSGRTLSWRNAASGTRGSVTPNRTWKTAKGVYCRSYSEIIKPVSRQSIRRSGVACRSPNAVWNEA